jgi:hypothetical protein
LCLRQGLVASAWLHRIEHLVPRMLDKAEKEGGIVVANLGHQRLTDRRVVAFTLAAKLAHQDAGGTHQRR